MSLLSFTHRPARAASGSVLRAATDLIQAAAQEWSFRRASLALQKLDDGVLHDIGVARGDIDTAVRHGRAGLAG